MSPRAAAAGDGRPPKDWHVMIHGRDKMVLKLEQFTKCRSLNGEGPASSGP